MTDNQITAPAGITLDSEIQNQSSAPAGISVDQPHQQSLSVPAGISVDSSPVTGTGTPPQTEKTVVQPEETGGIHKLWNWVNQGLISKDTVKDVMQRASATGKYGDVLTQHVHPVAHIPGFGNIDLDTLQQGVMDSTAGVLSSLSSPLSIMLFGTGAAANTLSKAGPAGLTAAKVLVGGGRAAGGAIAATQIPEIIKGQQPGESPADALERRLNAAGWTMLAGAHEGKISDALSRPVNELPEGVRSDVARFKAMRQATFDKVGAAIGKTDNFNTAVQRATKVSGKGGRVIGDKIGRVSDDLKSILNNDTDNKITSPGTAADAIDTHLKTEIERPLLEKAGATRDSTEPVVPNFEDRLRERLDKFFDDNRGRYGSEVAREAADKVVERVMQTEDHGDGLTVRRAPNLYEAENARQGLNEEGKASFTDDKTNLPANAYRAAANEANNFMRETIDESYDAKGIGGVKEARQKEADLIDIRDGLRNAQAALDKMDLKAKSTVLGKLFEYGKTAGIVGGLLGHFLTGPIGAIAGGAELWRRVYEDNAKDTQGNLERAQNLAGREPGAQATTPTDVPPQQGAVPPPPQPPAPKGLPPVPQPPTPVTAPEVNHRLNGALASYYGEFLGDTPYKDNLQKFSNEVADMKQDIANKGGKYSQAQIDKAMDLQSKINEQHSIENEQVEKANKAANDKYQKDLLKYQEKYKAAIAKEEAARAAKAAEQANAAGADERVAHGPVLRALDPAADITGVSSHTTDQIHGHEHGHIMGYVAEGLDPFQMISEHHPDAQRAGAAAAVQADITGAKEGFDGLKQRVTAILSGPAFDEVHNGIKKGDNVAARDDFRRAREILRDEGGITSGTTLDNVIDALYERAKEHVSNPEALALVEANKGLREVGLHKNYHISAGRMAEYVKKLKGAYRNETSIPDGDGEGEGANGTSQAGVEEAGRTGKDKSASGQGVQSEASRKTDEGKEQSNLSHGVMQGLAESRKETASEPTHEEKTPAAEAPNYLHDVVDKERKNIEQSNLKKKVEEHALPREFNVEYDTAEGPRQDKVSAHSMQEAIEIAKKEQPDAKGFSVNQGAEPGPIPYSVPTGSHLSTPDSRVARTRGLEPENLLLGTMRHELGHALVGMNEGLVQTGILRHTHPDVPNTVNAAVRWSTANLADLWRSAMRGALVIKSEHMPTILRALAGGIAADEAFSDTPREANRNNNSRLSGSDAHQAIGLIMAHGVSFPEASRMFNEAIDDAKTHLTRPEISDILNQNAGTREKGLSRQYHYSPERLNAMAAEVKRRLGAQNEPVSGTGEPNNGQVGGGGDQGGAVGTGGTQGRGEGGIGESVSNQVRTPPEHTTGHEGEDDIIRKAGGIPGGRLGGNEAWAVRMFHDPTSGTTLAFGPNETITPDTVKAKLDASREAYRKGDEANAARASQFEQSNLSKTKAKDVLDKIKERYGVTDNAAAVKNQHSFITPEGQFVHLEGTQHGDAIAESGGGNSNEKNGWDNRPEFVNKSGAVRVHGYNNRSGENLSFSVPAGGVSLEQLDSIRRATAEGLSRNGNLNIERADVKADTKDQLSKQKSFPRGGDVDQMLRDIKAHPSQMEQANANKNAPAGWITSEGEFKDLEHGYHEADAQMYSKADNALEDLINKGWIRKAGQGAYDVGSLNSSTLQAIESDLRKDQRDFAAGNVYGVPLTDVIIGTPKGDVEIPVTSLREHKFDLIKAAPALKHLYTAEKANAVKAPRWAQQAEESNKEGGFTVNPETGEVPTEGYMNEMFPEKRRVLDHPATAEDIASFAKDNKALLAQHPELHVGGYGNELNISSRFSNQEDAETAAKNLDQKSIWDVKNQKEIMTGGKGEQTSFPDYTTEARLADLSGRSNEEFNPEKQQLISTRVPTSKDATENHLEGEPLVINREAINSATALRDNKTLAQRMADKIKEIPGVKGVANLKDPQKVMDKFVDHVSVNLKKLYNQVPQERRDANAKWYESANKLAQDLADKYGRTPEQMSAVIAAMSPQKDWDMNVGLAKRVANIYHTKADIVMTPEMEAKAKSLTDVDEEGKTLNPGLTAILDNIRGKSLNELHDPIEKAAWIRIYDEAHNPRSYQHIDPATGDEKETVMAAKGPAGIAWGSLNEIGNAVSVLENGSRENISNHLGGSHKVRNFYNNILDPNNPAGHVTVDTHAVAAGLVRALGGKSDEVLNNFGRIGSAETGVKGMYPLYAEAYRKAAAQLGIQPRQLQSIVWEEVRNMFPVTLKLASASIKKTGNAKIDKAAEVNAAGVHVKAIDQIWRDYAAGKQTLDKTHQLVSQYAQDVRNSLDRTKPAMAAGRKVKAQQFLDFLKGE
ncbi:Uncharacterised protein [uncultured archaeon]|nr:Uncharacterised protein [uncultured archaeon]